MACELASNPGERFVSGALYLRPAMYELKHSFDTTDGDILRRPVQTTLGSLLASEKHAPWQNTQRNVLHL